MPGLALRRIGLLVVLYALGLSFWWWFAISVVPRVIESTFAGRSSPMVARAVANYAGVWQLKDVLKHWKIAAPAVVLAGICHFGLVLMVTRWRRRLRPARTVAQARFDLATAVLLIVLSLAFMLLTVWEGSIQDYYFFGQIWEQIVRGRDPWFLVRGEFLMYPLNAYGPLFTLLAPLTLLNPLAPKIFFALAFWGFAAWLVMDFAPRRRFPAWAGLILLLWLANPYAWIEIAFFGHLDVLVGLLCIAAVECRMREEDYASAAWISAGTLLKFFPGVLVPFLMLDGPKIRVRFLVTTLALGTLGMGAACLIWGPSPLRPLTFAAIREPAHLSIWRYMTGSHAPFDPDLVFFTLDQAATPVLLIALAWLWTWTRRRSFEMFASCVLVVTVTLLLYKVGFTQYPMVLFVLGAYWFVRDRATLRRRVPLVASYCAYFAWIAYFDVLVCTNRVFRNVDWEGLPTFCLGCLLVASIVRAAPPAVDPEAAGEASASG